MFPRTCRVYQIATTFCLIAGLAKAVPVFAGGLDDPDYDLKAEDAEPVLIALLVPAVQKVQMAATYGEPVPEPLNRLTSGDQEVVLAALVLPGIALPPKPSRATPPFNPDVVILTADQTIVAGELVGADAFALYVQLESREEGGKYVIVAVEHFASDSF